MADYPIELRRCQHIKTNGTQCGSPALKEKKFCYFHQDFRAKVVMVSEKRSASSPARVVLPVFEDAASIQLMLRQVTELILRNQIDSKQAGQVLYALQIASSNLRQMNAEKPRPQQVVIDPKKVAETGVGMAPWSLRKSGEIEDPNDHSYLRQAREFEERFERALDREDEIKKWGQGVVSGLKDRVRNRRTESADELMNYLIGLQYQIMRKVLKIDPDAVPASQAPASPVPASQGSANHVPAVQACAEAGGFVV
jgi:hypothetical protein